MRALAALVACALVLAGCVRAPEEPEAAPPTTEEPVLPADHGGFGLGALRVLAVFADRTPLAGVNVTVGEQSTTTDIAGTARFTLPQGNYTLVATKAAHRSAQQEVVIVAGGETTAEVVLAAEDGGQHAHEVGFDAHTDVYAFEGHFDCTAVYVIIPGDCLIVVENVTSTAGLPDPVSNTTTERNVIDFPLDVNWSSLNVEMVWTEPNPPTSNGMTLALEPAEAPVDGHAAKYARVSGLSPLRIALAPGVQHETATLDDMPNPQGGEVIRTRAFVRGHAHNPGGTDFLGVGVATEFAFTLYVSVFYGEPAPEGYTAIR